MAELTISADEIRSAIENYVSSYAPDVSREEVGIVVDAGDGIAHVEGLPSAMANELLEFPGGVLGVALNLDARSIARVVSAVPLSDAQESRLAAALTAIYGRAMSVRTALDPHVQGGLVVRVGDEVIDGSVATRFAAARAALTN